ncbi:MAG: hypothetical protein J6X55_00615 [Victivallales bacterium]|nr:hypothetical protein [Victivallales bacterium]
MKSLVSAALLFLSLSLSATTYYVNNQTGNDANDGLSDGAPFLTIAKSMAVLQAGDTLIMAPGKIYYESMMMRQSGTPAKPITIEANGAVLSGRSPIPKDNWKSLDNNLWQNANNSQFGALRSRVFNDRDEMISVHITTKPQDLKPGEAVWNKDGIYLRLEDGQKPQDLALFGTYRQSGVMFQDHSYITVNNIIVENFSNDGVNAHGYCRGLIFRNLVSRWNGDDGFSIHEDVQACLYGAHLHHNDFGIQDISISRSSFFGVHSEDNREIGGDFSGGMRSIEDSLFRNNGKGQLRFLKGTGGGVGFPKGTTIDTCRAYLKNVLVTGGAEFAVRVCGGAAVTASQCTFAGTETGIVVDKNGEMSVSACAVVKTTGKAIVKEGTMRVYSCAFSPATALWDGQDLSEKALLEALGDKSSTDEQPSFRGRYRAGTPALPFMKTQKAPGFDSTIDLPFIPEPPDEMRMAVEPVTHDYDFESINPLSRFYYENAPKGVKVKGSSSLSNEQAISGKQSAKITAEFPASNAPYNCFIKVFSVPFKDVTTPISKISCKMYAAGQGNGFRLRIRDRDGECFYGPMQKLDWNGWKDVVWDLSNQPPTGVAGGNRNTVQDCPPLEIVIEVYFSVPKEGHSFVLFVDDLSF